MCFFLVRAKSLVLEHERASSPLRDTRWYHRRSRVSQTRSGRGELNEKKKRKKNEDSGRHSHREFIHEKSIFAILSPLYKTSRPEGAIRGPFACGARARAAARSRFFSTTSSGLLRACVYMNVCVRVCSCACVCARAIRDNRPGLLSWR